jgi:hypothetical protein
MDVDANQLWDCLNTTHPSLDIFFFPKKWNRERAAIAFYKQPKFFRNAMNMFRT